MVTGASGLLGANLLLQARDHHERVVAVYHHHRVSLSGVTSVQADLTSAAALRRLMMTYRPQWVIHCAAMTDVDRCELDPEAAWRMNADVPHRLAVEAEQMGCRVLYVSTDSVFDGQRGGYSEEDPPNPVNAYGRSKLAGERAILCEMETGLVVRTCFYGWNAQDKPSLAEKILQTLEQGEVFHGYKDVVFTPILVNDLAELILQMMSRGLTGVVHAVGSESCTKYDFALQLAQVFGLDIGKVQAVSLAEKPLSASRPPILSLRSQRLQKELSLSLPNVEAGLQDFKELRDSAFVTKLKALCQEVEHGQI